MEYLSNLPSYHRVVWSILYFAGAWVACAGSHVHLRSTPVAQWISFVSKYGKEYPSLNNKWTVDGFVGTRSENSFQNIENEFKKLTEDTIVLRRKLDEIGSDANDALVTITKIDEYLDRWRGAMYLLQKVYDKTENGTLPIETMRRAAAGQLKALFRDASQELPTLLSLIDTQIKGNHLVGDIGLLCQFMTKKVKEMSSMVDSPLDLKMAVNQSKEFLRQLMKLQVRGTLLYDMTCSPEDIACRQKIVLLERDLQSQSQRLGNCTPMLMTSLSQESLAEDLYFVHLFSSEVLYIPDSKVLTSQKGNLDLTQAKIRGCAIKCTEKRYSRKDSSVWKLEDASPYGKLGYFIRGKNDCYVGFDRYFLSFIQNELNDPKAAGAEDDEALLCRPDKKPSRQTTSFILEPLAANHTSSYRLKNVLTGKYLRAVRTSELLTDKTTGGHVVNLVLQKCEHSQFGCTWGITKDFPDCTPRSTYDYLDMFIMKLYLLLMGVLFIMLIASLVVIWLYRKQIRRDYLQYRRVNTQEVIIPPSYRFPSRT